MLRIVQQRAAGNDQHPVGVPDAAADETAGLGGFGVIVNAVVVVGAEAREAPDLREAFRQRIVHRNPGRIIEVIRADWERRGNRLIHHAPFPGREGVAGRRAKHIHAGREQIYPRRGGQT